MQLEINVSQQDQQRWQQIALLGKHTDSKKKNILFENYLHDKVNLTLTYACACTQKKQIINHCCFSILAEQSSSGKCI